MESLNSKFTNSLLLLTDQEVQILDQKLSSNLFSFFNNLILETKNGETEIILTSLKEQHIHEKQTLLENHNISLEKHTEERNKWHDEINEIVSEHKNQLKKKDQEITDLEQSYKTRIKNVYDDINVQVENKTSSLNSQIEFLIGQNNTSTQKEKERHEKEIYRINEYMNKVSDKNDQTSINIIEKIENISELISHKKTNSEKGVYGENLIAEALNINPRFSDLEIEDVSGVHGNGDLVVHIPSENLEIMIESKFETEIKSEKDLGQFNNHKMKFFNEHEKTGHALFFSLNCDRIPGMFSGKYVFEGPKRKNLTGYFAKKNMTKEEIIQNFYYCIDRVIVERDNNILDNNKTKLYEKLYENNNIINDQIKHLSLLNKNHKDDIKKNDIKINQLDNMIMNNNDLLKEEGQLLSVNKIKNTKSDKI